MQDSKWVLIQSCRIQGVLHCHAGYQVGSYTELQDTRSATLSSRILSGSLYRAARYKESYTVIQDTKWVLIQSCRMKGILHCHTRYQVGPYSEKDNRNLCRMQMLRRSSSRTIQDTKWILIQSRKAEFYTLI